MGTSVVTLCGLCGKPVVDFFYKVRTNEGDKALCLECAGANTIQQLSDIGFIDAPEEIADAPLFEAKTTQDFTDEAEEMEEEPF